MSRPGDRLVLIVHAKDEEDRAELLSGPLRAAGYTVTHRGTVQVGQSIVGETNRSLEARPPVVLCGTVRAVGTKWGRTLANTARERGLSLLIVHMEEDADVDSLSFGEKIAGYWTDPDRAVGDLLMALRAYYPEPSGDGDDLQSHADYERRYRDAVVARFGEMELFGVPGLSEEVRTHDLSLAYVTLSLAVGRGGEDGPGNSLFEEILDDLSDESGRLMIEGVAGGGKTTLLRWLTVEAAGSGPPGRAAQRALKAGEPGEEASRRWRQMLPLPIRLRDCEGGRLPPPDRYHSIIVPALGPPPTGWAVGLLRAKRALVLLDGIDEVPVSARDALREDIKTLVEAYPGNLYILSTRPGAVREGWLAERGFRRARINPMSDLDRRRCIERWHAAVAERFRRTYDEDDPKLGLAATLIATLEETPSIARLATNPLLCAMICALHRDLDRRLPENQAELSDELIKLLLEQREKQIAVRIATPPYDGFNYTQKRTLIRHLAYDMVKRERQSLAFGDAEQVIARVIADFPGLDAALRRDDAAAVRGALLERSGILREVQHDTIDFLHNTFKEYLAAEAFVARGEIGELVRRSSDPSFRNVILFAVGSDHPEATAKLINGLLPGSLETAFGFRRRLPPPLRSRLILAIQCRYQGLRVPEAVQRRVDAYAERIFQQQTLADAEPLSVCGEVAVPWLTARPERTTEQAAACVRTLRLIGGTRAHAALERYLDDERPAVVSELAQAVHPLRIKAFVADLMNGRQLPRDVARQIVDLRPVLADLAGVKSLDLDGTAIENLDTLEGLTGLERLDLTRTPVSDFTPLARLTGLEQLSLNATAIQDLSPLRELQGLRELSLGNMNSLTDLRPLAALSRLARLSLKSTGVQDFSVLASLTGLNRLDLSVTKFADFANIESLVGLKELDLSFTGFREPDRLERFTALQDLNLASTAIDGLGFLRSLTDLTGLILSLANVSDLTGIERCGRLMAIHLRETRVTDLRPLRGLRELFWLSLSRTGVEDVSPLEGLPKLYYLDLSETPVSDLGPLRRLPELHELNLRGAAVTDLRPLARSPKLEKIIMRPEQKERMKIPRRLAHAVMLR